jgi:hypothetical protein
MSKSMVTPSKDRVTAITMTIEIGIGIIPPVWNRTPARSDKMVWHGAGNLPIACHYLFTPLSGYRTSTEAA